MTITLRNTTATGATTKNDTLTYSELDGNFVDLLTNKLANISEDTTPQLGGALDAQSNNFTNVGTLNTHTIPGGTGTIALTSDITGGDVVDDTTPQLGGDLESNGNEIKMADSTGLIRFNNTGMILFSNSGDSFITSTQPVQMNLNSGATQFTILNETANTLFKVSQNGVTELYHGTSKKFETASGGVSVTGTLNGHTIPGGTGTIALTSDITSSIANVVEDTTPQLGGNLDVNGNKIITASGNANLKLAPHGTGVVEIEGDGSSADGTIQLNCSQNSHGIKLASPPHSASQSYTITFPSTAPGANKIFQTDANGDLTFVDMPSGLSNISEDSSPQLGGSLDVNGNAIVSTSNANININPDGSGKVQINNTYTLPNADGSNGQVLTTDGAGTLSFTTVSSGGGGLSNISEDTTPQLGGNLDVNSQDIVSASNGNIDIQPNGSGKTNIKNITYNESVHDIGTTSGTKTPDVNDGPVQTITLSGDLTINAFASPQQGQSLTLIITQDGTGGRTLSSTFKFAGGTKTLSTAASAIDIMSVFYDGSNYWASLSTNFS
jgi:hypothetical protein